MAYWGQEVQCRVRIGEMLQDVEAGLKAQSESR
jgi:hypothetical protein